MRGAGGLGAIVLIATVVVGGCGSSTPSAIASASTSLPAATVSSVPTTAAPSSSPSTSASTSASSSASGLAIDPALLDLLPAQLSGLDRQVDRDVDARAFGDPALRSIGTAGASALYIDPSSGDFAYATLIRLADGRIGDSAFRAYRDSFDAGACSQAGGLAGNAETTLGGRRTFIGSCAGGLLTYHAVIAKAGVLLSISSAGERHLGEQLAEAVGG